MLHYKTLNEVKQNLPEIIDRINTCKIYLDCSTMMLKGIERWCVKEAVDESANYGSWTTLKVYAETLKNQMQYLSEIEYLQSLVEKIRLHPEI